MAPDTWRETLQRCDTEASWHVLGMCVCVLANGRVEVPAFQKLCPLLPPCAPTDPRHQAARHRFTVLSALSPFTVGVGHGHRRNHSHARLAAHAAASYLPNGTSVLTAADSKRLFHPPPWMVGFVARYADKRPVGPSPPP